MNFRTFISGFLLVAISSNLTGCGSDAPKTTTNTDRSVGQQLTDLDQARREGIITNREYDRLKKKIIKDND